MTPITVAQASAIMAFLANLVSAATVTCNSGINGQAFHGVTCTGPPIVRSGPPHMINYGAKLSSEFAKFGTDVSIETSVCPLETFEFRNAPGGRILQGGSSTQLPNTGGKANSNKAPHGAKVTERWDVDPSITIVFYGHIDGFGNYKLCNLEIVGDSSDSVTCDC